MVIEMGHPEACRPSLIYMVCLPCVRVMKQQHPPPGPPRPQFYFANQFPIGTRSIARFRNASASRVEAYVRMCVGASG